MIVSIPILDRLSFRDFQNIIFTVIFFIFESFIRIIVTLLPNFVIDFFDNLIEVWFPWLSKSELKPRVSPLEKAPTFEKIMNLWGCYEVEQHLVRTKDDYLLCAHRIPGLKSFAKNKEEAKKYQQIPILNKKGIEAFSFLKHFPKKEPIKTKDGKEIKPVVLIYHGFLMSSEIWVCNLEEYQNLPLLLTHLGYDVWLGNARGNKYSQNHLKLKANDIAFWNFSLNEYALYDLPDTVEYILNETGQKNLTYIGFSQGTAQGFSSLSINKKLNEQINLFIALAPATTPEGLNHPLIDAFVKAAPAIVYLIFGRKVPLELAIFWQRVVSPPIFVSIIDTCVQFLFGWKGKNMSPEQKIVSYQHLYSTTSVKSLVVSDIKYK
ncbi:unnamed protein product [Cunninghamella blakesleeana]